jgi:hypothetical protein
MTMTEHLFPITPPPEIVREWQIKIEYCSKRADREAVVAKIFQLGADMELEACCEWLSVPCPSYGRELRNARRPKPPSLKAQSIALIDKIQGNKEMWDIRDLDVIRQALESLPN